jgi:hypothetical protein
MKRGLLGIVGLLFLTGCSNAESVTFEDQMKLVEYENCLVLQQDNLNIINEQLAREESLDSLIEILSRQADPKENTRFDIHLKNCERFRP